MADGGSSDSSSEEFDIEPDKFDEKFDPDDDNDDNDVPRNEGWLLFYFLRVFHCFQVAVEGASPSTSHPSPEEESEALHTFAADVVRRYHASLYNPERQNSSSYKSEELHSTLFETEEEHRPLSELECVVASVAVESSRSALYSFMSSSLRTAEDLPWPAFFRVNTAVRTFSPYL